MVPLRLQLPAAAGNLHQSRTTLLAPPDIVLQDPMMAMACNDPVMLVVLLGIAMFVLLKHQLNLLFWMMSHLQHPPKT